MFVEDPNRSESIDLAEDRVIIFLKRPRIRLAGNPILANRDWFEEGSKTEIIGLRNRVVLVVVAVGTVQGQSEKRLAGMFDVAAHPVVRIQGIPVPN